MSGLHADLTSPACAAVRSTLAAKQTEWVAMLWAAATGALAISAAASGTHNNVAR
jgi:hypothetical protein